MKSIATTISEYNKMHTAKIKDVCDFLEVIINKHLKKSESKIWHGSPVWFLDGNPIVGYSKQKAGIRLMFWSGTDFEESGLEAGNGKFKDASVYYNAVSEINKKDLKNWLKKSRDIQWDYKNIIKRKGKLKKLLTLTTKNI